MIFRAVTDATFEWYRQMPASAFQRTIGPEVQHPRRSQGVLVPQEATGTPAALSIPAEREEAAAQPGSAYRFTWFLPSSVHSAQVSRGVVRFGVPAEFMVPPGDGNRKGRSAWCLRSRS